MRGLTRNESGLSRRGSGPGRGLCVACWIIEGVFVFFPRAVVYSLGFCCGASGSFGLALSDSEPSCFSCLSARLAQCVEDLYQSPPPPSSQSSHRSKVFTFTFAFPPFLHIPHPCPCRWTLGSYDALPLPRYNPTQKIKTEHENSAHVRTSGDLSRTVGLDRRRRSGVGCQGVENAAPRVPGQGFPLGGRPLRPLDVQPGSVCGGIRLRTRRG